MSQDQISIYWYHRSARFFEGQFTRRALLLSSAIEQCVMPLVTEHLATIWKPDSKI